MLKTHVKQCEATYKKMPQSFMIRFVLANNRSQNNKSSEQFLSPNFTATDVSF